MTLVDQAFRDGAEASMDHDVQERADWKLLTDGSLPSSVPIRLLP